MYLTIQPTVTLSFREEPRSRNGAKAIEEHSLLVFLAYFLTASRIDPVLTELVVENCLSHALDVA